MSAAADINMALFCDFENVALGVRESKYDKFDINKVLERLLLKGSIVVKKAYCDWERYREFKAPMHEAAFELIGYAKMSGSAAHARALGLLRASDGISMNSERLVADAKAAALALEASYAPGLPRQDIPVEGEAGYALLKMGLYLAHQGGYISEYDTVVGEKLAHVLSGGQLVGPQPVSEQYLLDLEREAFLSLCGQPKTQQRIEYMLRNGKPLRN